VSVLLSPTAISNKWLTNYQNAAPSITAGVNAVTVSPGAAAAAASGLWLQRVQASQAKWAARVGAVPLGEWQQAMITRGIPNGVAGAQAKQGKYTAFITSYCQFLPGAMAQVRAMPKGTLAQSGARALAMMNLSAQWGATRV
jgi:hypothetical protein